MLIIVHIASNYANFPVEKKDNDSETLLVFLVVFFFFSLFFFKHAFIKKEKEIWSLQ